MTVAPQFLAAIHMPREVIFGFLVALAIVLALTPAIGSLARRAGIVDEPGERRLNELPIPRLGGIALFFAIFVPSLAFLDLSRPQRAILIGAGIATVVGAIDDARSLVWWQKLSGQTLAAGVTAGLGVYVDHFTVPVLGVGALPKGVGIALTILWIVAIMNMVNFLDGLDGLAAGVCAISALTFSLIALSLDRAQPAILSAIVFGAALGFLRHNFYPARIFMGDSGALLLGFVLAAISVEGLLKTAAAVALAFPLLVLAIPIIDTSFVVAKRIKHGKPIYSADRFHLHHRFIDRGFSQRQAVLTMYVWCATLAGAALATRFLAPHAHGRWQLWPSVVDGADRARRARRLRLHRLRARDRQGRESAHPAAKKGGRAGTSLCLSLARRLIQSRLEAAANQSRFDLSPRLGHRGRAVSSFRLRWLEREEKGEAGFRARRHELASEGLPAAGSHGASSYLLCWRPVGNQHGVFLRVEGGEKTTLPLAPPGPTPTAKYAGRAGHWYWAALSPDGTRFLAQWSGECEVPTAFFVSLAGGKPIPVTGESDWAKSPNTMAYGWTPDGRAIVFIPTKPACGTGIFRPGIYLVAESCRRELIWAGNEPPARLERSLEPRTVARLKTILGPSSAK